MNDNDILLLIGQQRGKNVAPRRLLPRAAHQSQQGIQPPRILEVTTVGSVGLGIVGTWNRLGTFIVFLDKVWRTLQLTAKAPRSQKRRR